MKIWLRPVDLSETLNTLERNAPFNEHLAPGAVGVLGLSMGGSTALALAGARIDGKSLAGYCDTDARNASLCGWVRQSGVDLRAGSGNLHSGDEWIFCLNTGHTGCEQERL